MKMDYQLSLWIISILIVCIFSLPGCGGTLTPGDTNPIIEFFSADVTTPFQGGAVGSLTAEILRLIVPLIYKGVNNQT